MAIPMINILGPSGYPALQTLLYHAIGKSDGLLLFQNKKSFLVLLAAAAVEILAELF
jgi:hypothetical protein